MDGHVTARGFGTISGHTGTDRTHGRKPEVKFYELNNDTGKRTTWPLTQNRLSYMCVEWVVKGDNDARPPFFLAKRRDSVLFSLQFLYRIERNMLYIITKVICTLAGLPGFARDSCSKIIYMSAFYF